MFTSRHTRQRGFTLIELVVVIVIIGILAAFAIPRFAGLAKDARVASIRGLLGTVRSSSALVHGMSLARPTEDPITLEGSTVDILNSYPAPTAIGIVQAMGNLDANAYLIDYTTADTATFTAVGAPSSGANCKVTYKLAAADAVPTIQSDESNC